MEDWDLADHAKFPHLAIEKYMRRVYYAESGVTVLEIEEWFGGVEHSIFLNLLWVHITTTPPSTRYVCTSCSHFFMMVVYG